MGTDQMPFADNWAYLKTELAWLDRLLMLAITRQRKETKTVSKVATTSADRLSAHWWKGVISVPNPKYDDSKAPFTPKKSEKSASHPATTTTEPATTQCKATVGYQSQLEQRIKASAQANIVLALPSLRHYLNLTLFEKNLILMVLAPEVNRRYGKLYHFLQTGEEKSTRPTDLPMLDLALRLLCRNDLERRRARAKLTGPHSLITKQILRYVSLRPGTRLMSYLQLSEEWVDYFLSEKPDQQFVFKQLAATHSSPVLALPAPTPATRAVKITQPEVTWDQLILPTPVMGQLQSVTQQTSASLLTRATGGQVAMLVGERGTGKTMAAGAIATSVRQTLSILDLAEVDPKDWMAVLDSLDAYRYPVLLIKSASIWFGRSHSTETEAQLTTAQLQKWLKTRRAEPGITLLSSRYLHVVQARWRQKMNAILSLPMPYKVARTMLWRQAFSGITCSNNVDWKALAEQLKVSGGEIQQLAKGAVAIAQSKNAKTITLSHIQQAIKQRGLTTNLT